MGIFARPSTCVSRVFSVAFCSNLQRRHITGLVARMAMGIQYPPPSSSRGAGTYSVEEYLLAVLAFGFGGFVSGFVLTVSSEESLDRRVYPIKMNFPSPAHWRYGHQVLLSLSILLYGVANALFQSTSGGNRNFARSPNVVIDLTTTPAFVLSWLLNIFASGLVNGLLCTGAQITLRAGNMDGHVLDAFMGLADAMCSRSLRNIWRVRAQMLAIISFFSGCLIGSVVFESEFGASALSFACILLSPMWLLGVFLLLSSHKEVSVQRQQPRDLHSQHFDAEDRAFTTTVFRATARGVSLPESSLDRDSTLHPL